MHVYELNRRLYMRIFSEDVLNEILDSCETVQQVRERLEQTDKDIDLDVIDAVGLSVTERERLSLHQVSLLRSGGLRPSRP